MFTVPKDTVPTLFNFYERASFMIQHSQTHINGTTYKKKKKGKQITNLVLGKCLKKKTEGVTKTVF